MDGVRGFLVPAGAGLPTRVRAANRKLKVTGIDTGGAFMVTEFVLIANIPPHVHLRQHESFYVLDGALTVHVGDDELDAGAGDFVFLPSDVPHALTVSGDSPPTLLVIATPNARGGGVWPVVASATDGWGRVRHPGWVGLASPGAGPVGPQQEWDWWG